MAKILKIDLSDLDEDALCTVAHELMHGRVVIHPTDTIYGIGADACNPTAVERVFQVKRRDPAKPILVLVSSIDLLRQFVEEIPVRAQALIEKFWPGPLTLIFRASPSLSPKLTGGLGTIGFRVPRNPFCLRVLEICRRPVTSTSANLSGQEQPLSVNEIVESFEQSVDLIVDAGNLTSAKPSTVVDVTGDIPKIIREGVINSEVLRPFLSTEA